MHLIQKHKTSDLAYMAYIIILNVYNHWNVFFGGLCAI